MSITTRERCLLRSLQRGDMAIGSKEEYLRLTKKIEMQRAVMIKRILVRTDLGVDFRGDLEKIGRTMTLQNRKRVVRVLRIIRKALQDIGLLAMPNLDGLDLTRDEKKLLVRIRERKRQFLAMVLTEHKKRMLEVQEKDLEYEIQKQKEEKELIFSPRALLHQSFSLLKDCKALARYYQSRYQREKSNIEKEVYKKTQEQGTHLDKYLIKQGYIKGSAAAA